MIVFLQMCTHCILSYLAITFTQYSYIINLASTAVLIHNSSSYVFSLISKPGEENPVRLFPGEDFNVCRWMKWSNTCHLFWLKVLATGLSGLYSSLPTKLDLPSEEWHCLHREDWQQLPALVQFLNSLEFCNAVIQVCAIATSFLLHYWVFVHSRGVQSCSWSISCRV